MFWRLQNGGLRDQGLVFGAVQTNGNASCYVNWQAPPLGKGAWHFNGETWVEDQNFLRGLELNGVEIKTVRSRERSPDFPQPWVNFGVRFRDVGTKHLALAWAPLKKL